MITEVKQFNALSPLQLYKILNLRNLVFVVEQNCPYLDTDGKDFEATHVLIWNKEELVAYARVLKPGVTYETSCISRVIVHPDYRKLKLGHLLIRQAIETVNSLYATNIISISAQAHLQKFYNSHGFQTVSEEYLEDNIPHVKMMRK